MEVIAFFHGSEMKTIRTVVNCSRSRKKCHIRFVATTNMQCPSNACPMVRGNVNIIVPIHQWFLTPISGNVRLDGPNLTSFNFISVVGSGTYTLSVRVIFHCRPIRSRDLNPSQVFCTTPIVSRNLRQ